MDTLSHGLWGSLAFGRKNRQNFWLAFFFGVAPDIFSFGIFIVSVFLGFASGINWSAGPPDQSLIPQYVHSTYNITHSLIVFAAAFSLVWLARRRPLWEMAAWGLHIIMDIPTHSNGFFPTPFLWPISSFHISGIPWSRPIIFIPNVVLLGTLYLWFFVFRGRFRN
jgi:hypothetical protein